MNPDLLQHIKQRAIQISNKANEYREHIHKFPELSFLENETMKYVSDVLKKLKIPHNKEIGGTGVVALISPKNHSNSTAIALRADLDALPIQEETNKEYSSVVSGVMHACGHDVHTAILLGAAQILNECKDDLSKPVKLIFQPGEEKSPGGATLMLSEGVLENPKVDEMYALHVFPDLNAGKVGFRPGRYMASCDEIYITIEGKGGHAAMPDKCIDPITIGATIVLQLQQIISRKCDPKIPCVLSFGSFEGGSTTNVIPSTVTLKGTFRTMDEKWREQAILLIKNQVAKLAELNGAKSIIEIIKGYPCLDNDPLLTQRLKEKAQKSLGGKNVIDLPIRLTSEDFSFYSQQIPVCFFRLGVRNEGKGIIYNVHHPKFDIDKRAITTGIEMMCLAAI